MSKARTNLRSPSTPAKYKAPHLTVPVEQDIIDAATRKSSSHCVIADAIKRHYPRAYKVSVDLQTVRFSDETKGLRFTYLTPRPAQQALVLFDRGDKIPPFQFRLRGAHITTMFRSDPNKRQNLGKRRIAKRSSNNAIPDQIGGPALPKSPALSGTRREYGLRAFPTLPAAFDPEDRLPARKARKGKR